MLPGALPFDTADDERGASAVEYGLLIAGIAAFIVIVIFAFSGTVTGLFSDTCATIDSVAGVGSC